jgi:hypothetical protein
MRNRPMRVKRIADALRFRGRLNRRG